MRRYLFYANDHDRVARSQFKFVKSKEVQEMVISGAPLMASTTSAIYPGTNQSQLSSLMIRVIR
jgi:hypothetical protein